MNEELEVGMMVQCVSPYDSILKGMTGRIVHIHPHGYPAWGVEWEGLEGGHNCEGNCPSGKGWYVDRDNIAYLDTGVSLKVWRELNT